MAKRKGDTGTPCQVGGCGKPIKCRGLCVAHYAKLNRYGSPTPNHPPKWLGDADIRGRRFGLLVVRERAGKNWLCDCDCGGTHEAYAGHLNAGSATRCDNPEHWLNQTVGYVAAHNRVRWAKGRAYAHQCVDCGSIAREWSYMHNDPNEIVSTQGTSAGCYYSLDVDCYEPRCKKCHRAVDSARGLPSRESRSAWAEAGLLKAH